MVQDAVIGNKKAATLIELVMMVVVLAIIGVTVSGVIIFFAQLFMYSPRQLDAQKIGQELVAIMLEGNQDKRGIRYTRTIIDASGTQFSYIYGYPVPFNSGLTTNDQLGVRLRWDSTSKHIFQSASTNGGSSWSAESLIPYYMPSTVTIDGKDTPSVIFTYKKANNADWVSGTDALSTIRRVIISINLKTGSGSFSGWQGSNNITSSVELKGF